MAEEHTQGFPWAEMCESLGGSSGSDSCASITDECKPLPTAHRVGASQTPPNKADVAHSALFQGAIDCPLCLQV